MSLWNLIDFSKAVETARGAPTVPRLVEWIDASRIRHDPDAELVDGKEFTPGECYFTLRLSGLHLAICAGSLSRYCPCSCAWRSFVPAESRRRCRFRSGQILFGSG